MKKETFILNTDLDEKTKSLTDAEIGQVFRKVLKYVKEETLPRLTDKLEIVFDFIKFDIDKNTKRYEERCIQNKENGKKGGAPKGNQNAKKEKQPKTTETTENNMTYHNHTHIHNHLEEEKKDNRGMGEEEKGEKPLKAKIHFAEFVTMTNAEYETLVSTHGKEFADQCITVLDNYKGSSGKKYKSDYRAILSWVVDKVQKEQQAMRPQKKSSNPFREIAEEEGLI